MALKRRKLLIGGAAAAAVAALVARPSDRGGLEAARRLFTDLQDQPHCSRA